VNEMKVILLKFLKTELSRALNINSSVVVGFVVVLKEFLDWGVFVAVDAAAAVVVADDVVVVVDDNIVDDEDTNVRTVWNTVKKREMTNCENVSA